MRRRTSHGTGQVQPSAFRHLGEGVVIEPGALFFHPESISLGDGVYIGHYAILNGYHRGSLEIGAGTWIGPHAFLHAGGGIVIGEHVGLGPGVRILTSAHALPEPGIPILDGELLFAAVRIGEGSDLGVNAVVLPGVCIGSEVQVGAGAVVDADLPDRCVAAGVPARILRRR